jgi:LuxR family maltose regulon positive regulatory protein
MSAMHDSSHLPLTEEVPSFGQHRLLTTKLSATRLRSNLVLRSGLINAISYADVPLTVVCGPAGYGKTTLVTQWMISSGAPAAWVQLDAFDNDPWHFLHLIASAVETIDRDIAADTLALLRDPGQPHRCEVATASLLEGLAKATHAFALVLDDYQVIDSPGIHDIMRAIVQHPPLIMRVFIISRSEPPLQLAGLRGRHQVLELGQEDLRFTHEEALELLHVTNGIDVTPGEVNAINDRAEGWVAGLQLAAYMMHAQSKTGIRHFVDDFCGSVRSIEHYLLEEVIGRQSPAIQDFLLRTSILDRFSAPLCAAVTGMEESRAVIRHLERNNLFVMPLDHLSHWYRFHYLFSDVLRDRLAQELSEEEINELHRSAAAWLEENDSPEEAARHAVAGQDWDRAATLLEQIGVELYQQDQLMALCVWLQGTPPATLERHPKLAFWLAYSLIRTGRFREAAQPLRIAEQAWAHGESRANLGRLRILQALRATANDPSQAIALAGEARDLLVDDQTGDLETASIVLARAHLGHGDTVRAEATYAALRRQSDDGTLDWIQLAEMNGSAEALGKQGKLLEAVVLHRRVIKMGGERHPLQSQRAHCALGMICIEWNMLDDGIRHYRHAEALAEQTQSALNQYAMCLVLARAHWAWGNVESAFDEIERSIEYASQMGFLQAARNARAQQARYWMLQGRVTLARRWSDSIDFDPYLPSDYDRQFEQLTFARLLIASEQPALALSILDAADELAASQSRAADRIEISVLRALAHKCQGDHANALAALHHALALGEPGGFVRTFADADALIIPLLRHASVHGDYRDYAQRLLTAIEGTTAISVSAQKETVEALSEREIQVLRLVAAGMSNRDIGRQLFIAERTAKKHLTNILGKLQATNRTQAVDNARRMGLF